MCYKDFNETGRTIDVMPIDIRQCIPTLQPHLKQISHLASKYQAFRGKVTFSLRFHDKNFKREITYMLPCQWSNSSQKVQIVGENLHYTTIDHFYLYTRLKYSGGHIMIWNYNNGTPK